MKTDREMLEFVVESDRGFHYSKGTDGKWYAMDCSNGLTFITRECDTLDEMVLAVMDYVEKGGVKCGVS